MQLKCQEEGLNQLRSLSFANRQSVLIEGPKGCGKSYLAKQYANMLQIDDYAVVSPKVSEIREALDACARLDNKLLLCIENLDLGVLGASYTLLKSLEEPMPNVYIVITCRNMQRVPDTIISRSAIVSINPPIDSDIQLYADTRDAGQANLARQRSIWPCVKTFADADYVLGMDADQFAYYDKIKDMCKFTDNVSNTVWAMQHYPDNKTTNIELVIRMIMRIVGTPFATKCCIDALTDLNQARIAEHAVLSKLVFNLKYCE